MSILIHDVFSFWVLLLQPSKEVHSLHLNTPCWLATLQERYTLVETSPSISMIIKVLDWARWPNCEEAAEESSDLILNYAAAQAVLLILGFGLGMALWIICCIGDIPLPTYLFFPTDEVRICPMVHLNPWDSWLFRYMSISFYYWWGADLSNAASQFVRRLDF